MGITSEGLTIKRYDEIVAGLEASLRSYLGNNIDLSENALLGIINIIYANSQAEQWEMSQAVYNAFNIEGATGKQLDDLVALVGMTRLNENFSKGDLQIKGLDGLSLPALTEFRTTDTDIPITLNKETVLTNTACNTAELEVATVVIGQVYEVMVSNVSYQYTSQIGDSGNDILTALNALIQADLVNPWTSSYDSLGEVLTITSDIITDTLSIIITGNIQILTLSVSSVGSTTISGAVTVNAGTVTGIPVPINGLISVNNPSDFIKGRLTETDDELRERHASSTSIQGASSPQSIRARISNLLGVTHVNVFENITMLTDIRGLPPKSFEVIVEGASDVAVAEELNAIRPAGIETYGTTTVIVEDDNGNQDPISFTRPVTLELFAEVVYTLYSEEAFPVDGETRIKDSISSALFELGEDAIAQRLYGDIYENVQGISNLSIKLGTTSMNITEDIIPISEIERATIPFANITI